MATRLKQSARYEVVPLSSALGAEIRGLDLREPMDDDTAAAIRQLWLDRSVLLFRDQQISEGDQFRFCRVFGPIADRVQPPKETRPPGQDFFNRMMLISNRTDAEGRPIGALGDGEMWFHTDKCYVARPHRASMLYSLEAPTEGGHTKWASLRRACERLPADLRRRLEGRKVLQAFNYGNDVKIDPDQPLDDIMHYWQPLFVTQPETSRKSLYVCRLMSILIEGMDKAESEATIDALCDIVEQPNNLYEHVWRVGDLVVWDNLTCVHARTDWPRAQPRSLRRCTTQGELLF